jgi:hypothetical protein
MHRLPILLLASTLFLSAPALAQSTSAMPSEHRLSEAEIEQVLDTAARRREGGGPSGDVAEPAEGRLPPAIHGEVGFSVGTGGYRSAFGTAIVPLPGDGVAVLSFGTDRYRFDHDFDRFDR